MREPLKTFITFCLKKKVLTANELDTNWRGEKYEHLKTHKIYPASSGPVNCACCALCPVCPSTRKCRLGVEGRVQLFLKEFFTPFLNV